MWGIFGRPLKKGTWNSRGLHDALTTYSRFWFSLDNSCVACCLFLSTNSYHARIQCTSCAFASEDALQKPLMLKRARSAGARWVQVTWRRPGGQVKKTSYSRFAATCINQ